jgi:hypothetical protein
MIELIAAIQICLPQSISPVCIYPKEVSIYPKKQIQYKRPRALKPLR